MPGQPIAFDLVTVIATEDLATPPQVPPYFIVELGDKLYLEACFHCGGKDKTVRDHVFAAMQNNPTVTYYFQDLHQNGNDIKIPHQNSSGVVDKAVADDLFKGAGALVDSNLDPTDDYYLFEKKQVNTAQFAAPDTLVVLPAETGTWRVTTVFRGVNPDSAMGSPENIVSAFDDSLIIQVIGT